MDRVSADACGLRVALGAGEQKLGIPRAINGYRGYELAEKISNGSVLPDGTKKVVTLADTQAGKLLNDAIDFSPTSLGDRFQTPENPAG